MDLLYVSVGRQRKSERYGQDSKKLGNDPRVMRYGFQSKQRGNRLRTVYFDGNKAIVVEDDNITA